MRGALIDACAYLLGAILKFTWPFETLNLHKIVGEAHAALGG